MHFKPAAAIISLILALGPHAAVAKDIPSNVKAFYDTVRNGGTCSGSDLLKGGFYDQDDGAKNFGYCQKYMKGKGFYIKGSGKKLANMDIDCDGHQTHGDGRCGGSDDTQGITRWQDEVKKYGGISDLNAYIHPYVVLGNEGSYSPTFDPRKVGVEPLSLVAVVCNDRLVYGVWGDTNGDDGEPLVGEASLALADLCFGKKYNADSGHDETDVLYIAFSGKHAVPGKNAKWDADNVDEFEESITALGDELVAGLGAPNSSATLIRGSRRVQI